MAQHGFTNGVDVDGLRAAMDTIQDQPEMASMQFRCKHRWGDNTHTYTTIQDFTAGGMEQTNRPAPFVMEADEPLILLGDDTAPNATEALLHALSSCLSTTFIYHASARGVEIDELELEMEGTLDVRGVLGLSDEVRNGFEQINVVFHVKSDAPEEQISELVELAQARSPVFDMVTHPTPVSVKGHKVEALTAAPTRASI